MPKNANFQQKRAHRDTELAARKIQIRSPMNPSIGIKIGSISRSRSSKFIPPLSDSQAVARELSRAIVN